MALGEALRARIEDVVANIRVSRAEASASTDPMAKAQRLSVARLATETVARWLSQGEGVTTDEWSELGGLGRLAATDHLSVAGMIKLNLAWRDATNRVLAEEARRLGCPAALLAEAKAGVRAGCDSSAVRMGHQFDVERQALLAALQEERSKLAHQALHDALTGLPNRRLLVERLGSALRGLERHPGRVGLVFMDLDGFKELNDSLGHEVGDAALQDVANLFKKQVRSSDTVSRFGGDEFVVLCARTRTDSDVTEVARRLCRSLGDPLPSVTEPTRLSVSAGTAETGDAGASPSRLLADADLAMYEAKRSRRGGAVAYRSRLRQLARAGVP